MSFRAFAAATLTVPSASEMPQSFQTNSSQTFELQYTDPAGDPVQKKNAVFTDESPAGTTSYTATNIEGTDTSKGVTIRWTINGFTQGGHHGYFTVTGLTGDVVRYPVEPGTFYSFTVESLASKFIIMAFGLLIGLVGIPFITYFLFRSLNKRGDPARAARVGLMIGILVIVALFIQQFTGVYNNPLILYGIPIIAAVASLILIFGRR